MINIKLISFILYLLITSNISLFANEELNEENKKPKFKITVNVDKSQNNTNNKLKKAYSMLLNNNYNGAIKIYTDVLNNEPNNYNALIQVAFAYQNNNQYDKASNIYYSLINSRKINNDIIQNLLISITNQNNTEEHLKKLLRIFSQHNTIPCLAAQISILYYNNKNYESAIKYMNNAITLDPSNIIYQYNLGLIMEHAGNTKDSYSIYKHIIKNMNNYKNNYNISNMDLHNRISSIEELFNTYNNILQQN